MDPSLLSANWGCKLTVKSIQYLRGIAACMVLVYHLQYAVARLGYVGPWSMFLSSGVDVFFVISGFIMWVTTADDRTPASEFLRRRIIRIVPLYWLLTTCVLAHTLLSPQAMGNGLLTAPYVAASYLFFPAVHPTEGALWPLLIPGWTLNYEMAFYALFGVGLLLPAAVRLATVSATLCALVAIPLLVPVPSLTAASFYTSPRLLEFVWGMGLGTLFMNGIRLPIWAAVGCMVAGVVGLVVGGLLVSGGSALLLVTGVIMIERAGSMPQVPALRLLGDASYSIYLSHDIVLPAVALLWLKTSLPRTAFVTFGAVEVVAAVGAGVLLYLWVEAPIGKFAKQRLTHQHR